jgi:hypothetical protein
VDDRPQGDQTADDVEIPGQQVDARERDVLGADHEGHEEIAEDRRDARDHEEEDHHDAVRREDLVVGLGLEDVSGRRQQLEPDQRRREAADREEDRDADQVHDRDPLVVDRQQPRPHAVAGVQVIRPVRRGGVRVRHGLLDFLSGAGVGAGAAALAAPGAG